MLTQGPRQYGRPLVCLDALPLSDLMNRHRNNTFRGGMIHVCERMCDTCIFRPGNLMHLKEGRMKRMVSEAIKDEGCIACHETLEGDNAVCRGFYEQHATQPLQVAQRLGCIAFDPPTGKEPAR